MRSAKRNWIGAHLLVLLALATPGGAQTEMPGGTSPKGTGSVDVGGRVNTVEGDPARNQRYRDLRTGPIIEGFRWEVDRPGWHFDAKATNAGYRDQRYTSNYVKPGRIKVFFQWDQIPLFNSTDTRTLFTEVSPGVFRVDDAIQKGIEAGTLTLAAAASQARPFDLRARRDIATARLTVAASKNLDLSFRFDSTNRTGAQQWGIGLGSTSASLQELPAPIEYRSNDVGTGVEWANDRGMVRIDYAGSWFNNRVNTLVVDNVLRFTDSTTATSQGRMSRWPDSSTNAINTSGLLKLPAHTTATAYLSIGQWNQNDELIPFTINTAFPIVPLARTTAEAKADVTAMNYTITSQPRGDLWFNARFKRYDFDNKTPHFAVTTFVRTDSAVSTSVTGGNEALGYIRGTFDADASYTKIPKTALRFGYGHERVERTFRFFDETNENYWRATADFSGSQYAMVRVGYEQSRRTGTGLDEEVLDEIGEQVSLRQFDVSNRDRWRLSTVLEVTPVPALGLTASIIRGNDDRPDAEFGLQFSKQQAYAVGVNLTPVDGTMFDVNYGFEDYKTLQNSRQANPGVQFNDPTRNWSTSGFDRVHTFNAVAQLSKIAPKTGVTITYDRSLARDRYVYSVPANTTLAAIAQLPAILEDLQRATVTGTYQIRSDVAASVVYWRDWFAVNDFAFSPDTITRIDMPGAILLGNVIRPYTFQTLSFRIRYFW